MQNDDLNDFFVPGFLANGIASGIKKDGGRDLALIYAKQPAVADAVFTTNAFQAAPVILGRERIGAGLIQAVLVNSGNANAATGARGYAHALSMSRAAAAALGIEEKLVMVSSTGVIGVELPLDNILQGMKKLVEGLDRLGLPRAHAAIMTTDRFPKRAMARLVIDGRPVTICGLAKGAGMIEPNMATMLAYLLTDAAISRELLKKIFRETVEKTFNAISVDGCMSTNDTALILASGAAGNKPLDQLPGEAGKFRDRLGEVMAELARAIVRDGEGATKVIEIRVRQARTTEEAKKLARAVANSNLVKTAFHGGDPNWGRIISALGSIGIPLPTDRVEVVFDGLPIFRGGQGVTENEERLTEIMRQPEITVELRLGMGDREFSLLTSDLSCDYVKINSHYRT